MNDRSRFFVLVLVLTLGSGAAGSAGAADRCELEGEPYRGWWSIVEENDAIAAFSGSDRFYTQGVRFSYHYERDCEREWMRGLGSRIGELLDQEVSRSGHHRSMFTTVSLGQHFFTPSTISVAAPQPDDRPYAAWLYGGSTFDFVDNGARTDAGSPGPDEDLREHELRAWYRASKLSVELQAGVLGPEAFGEEVQSEFHEWIDDEPPLGWDNQIPFQPGVLARLQRGTRIFRGSANFDVFPYWELALGNVQTYAAGGASVRFGKNIRGWHTGTLKPVAVHDVKLLGAPDVDPCWKSLGIVECYLFVGAEARLIGYNAFLDGTAFRDSPSVDKEPLVGDLTAGFRLAFKRVVIDYTFTRRSKEFDPVPPTSDRPSGEHDYGSLSIRWQWPWGCRH